MLIILLIFHLKSSRSSWQSNPTGFITKRHFLVLVKLSRRSNFNENVLSLIRVSNICRPFTKKIWHPDFNRDTFLWNIILKNNCRPTEQTSWGKWVLRGRNWPCLSKCIFQFLTRFVTWGIACGDEMTWWISLTSSWYDSSKELINNPSLFYWNHLNGMSQSHFCMLTLNFVTTYMYCNLKDAWFQ